MFSKKAIKDYKDLDKKDQKKVDRLVDNIKDGNLKGRNHKGMRDTLEGYSELRGSDGIRVVYDNVSKEVTNIFKKTGHDTTDMYMSGRPRETGDPYPTTGEIDPETGLPIVPTFTL